MVLAAWDYVQASSEITGGLARNPHGEGQKTEQLKVEIEGEDAGEVQIEVSEQAYSPEEVKRVFNKSIKKMEQWILGQNESFDRIESDMDLITEIPGEPIDVSWELDHYDVMNVYGELNEKNLRDEGTMVTLRAVLTYRERESEQALYECTVMVYPETFAGKEGVIKRIREKLKETDEKTKTKAVLILPDEIGGKKLSFYPAMDERGMVLIGMAALILCLLYALDKQNIAKMTEERRRQMRRDYPEIVSKLTLLLGAGMNIKRAWRKITDDYSAKEHGEKRYAYEEMKHTCREMESGIMESESYERFGRRCGLQEYVRLGALLSQNLRKGTKGLNDLLRMESAQAFEERKARAKRMGEEAGTKLLGPMFLMLAVVLVIVVVPAFLSIQI